MPARLVFAWVIELGFWTIEPVEVVVVPEDGGARAWEHRGGVHRFESLEPAFGCDAGEGAEVTVEVVAEEDEPVGGEAIFGNVALHGLCDSGLGWIIASKVADQEDVLIRGGAATFWKRGVGAVCEEVELECGAGAEHAAEERAT